MSGWGQPNQGGYNQGGYNQGGYNQGGYNQGGYNQGGYNQGGYNQGGYNQGGYNQGGYNQGPPPNQYPPQHYPPPQQGYGHPPPRPYPPPNGPPPPGYDAYGYPIAAPPPQRHHDSGYQSYPGAHARGAGAPPPPPSGAQEFGHGAPQGYTFQYSNCTGRRRALLIGINYFGQEGELRGCVNDVKNVSSFLMDRYGYRREDMVFLTDDQSDPVMQPTKANILRAMQWLVTDAQPNDSLFLHYSG